MPSLFLSPEFFISNKPIITGEKARYLSKVLRLKPGDFISLFDGQGSRYRAECVQFTGKKVLVRITSKEADCSKPSPLIILAQAILKGQKMDFVIQKAAELGTNRVFPLVTERTEVRTTAKHSRWQKIAQSASEQCGRFQIPVIEPLINIQDFVEQFKPGILFWEGEAVGHLKKMLNQITGQELIILLLGPEGGFSKAEVDMAKSQLYQSASLGPRILRAETATIAALSIVQYELGDLSK